MINVMCGIRSTGRICTDIAQLLEQQGHEVKIAYGRGEVPEAFRKYAVQIGSDLDVKLHGVKARLLDGAGFGSAGATREFIRWVKAFDPDVIHLHNIHGYYIHVGILFDYLHSCGKKIIWTLHDCWAMTGHSAYCDAAGCERWVDGCYKCPLLKEYPQSFVDRSAHNWKKKKECFAGVPDLTVVTPSRWLGGLVQRSFLGGYPVEVVNNGIDISQFEQEDSGFRRENGLEGKFLLLGVASVWNDMKGLSDFIRLREMLDDSYAIVLVGVTEQQQSTLPEGILGIRRTTSVRELARIYSAADLFVNLTYCDNFPTVNLEALACGTPVLTYETGGSPEAVRQYGGFVVAQGDLAAVAAQVEAFAHSGETPLKVFDKELLSTASAAARYVRLYEVDAEMK